jgi:hypothetical protein
MAIYLLSGAVAVTFALFVIAVCYELENKWLNRAYTTAAVALWTGCAVGGLGGLL